MANHLVGRVLVPDAVSGDVALEIGNTRAGWGAPSPREYLLSYDALAVWAGDVALTTRAETRALRRLAAAEPRAARRALAAALGFREAWYGVVTAPGKGRPMPPDDLRAVGAAVARATAVSTYRPDREGRVLPDGGDLDSAGLRLPLHRAALAAARLLADGDAGHVRACGGRGCGWLFVDRADRRRWCVMAICGNRAKARSYAERRREAARTG